MNPETCRQALDGIGNSVAGALYAIDCAATTTAQTAFGRLFGTDGVLLPALSVLLTLYIAFFAFSLITGRSRIGISALTPRMVTLGLVLTFVTSWIAYQGVMWNLAVGAPDQIAGILMGTQGSSTQIFADKIDVVFAALVEVSGNGATENIQSTFSPPGLLWLGGTLLLLGTVGLLATAKIALAILLAIGPVFIVMALFPATRGLFVGWLKGVVMLAITPLFAVLGGTLMLELSVPVLRALTQTPGIIDARAAMAFFMIGAVHCALMIMVLKVTGTMVANWSVFGLAAREGSSGGAAGDGQAAAAARAAASGAAMAAARAIEPNRGASPAPSRDIRVTAATPRPANDIGGAGGTTRETRVVGPAGGSAGAAPSPLSSRARGIGSRFRPAPARASEKFK